MIALETERLLFRAPEMQDLDAYCAMEMDPEMRRFVGGYPRTREEAEQRFRKGRRQKGHLPFYAMIYKAENRYIGRCGLHPMPGGAIGLGFYVAKPYWGRGLATEAARVFVDYGFHELKLPRIISSVEVGNAASVRVLQKLGFRWVCREDDEQRSFDHFELRNPRM